MTFSAPEMQVIGLTGGIACGKSTISLTLRELGAVIIDGDVLSRQLTADGGAALPDIRSAFGDDVFCPDGSLDRRALGARVFSDDHARAMLDGIMQPLLLTLILLGVAFFALSYNHNLRRILFKKNLCRRFRCFFACMTECKLL